MTDSIPTFRAARRIATRLRRWSVWPWRAAPTAGVDTLPDHLRRDIGVDGARLDQMSIRTAHDAMRFSG